ncbi:unnamed protein product [Psylliodes chrysocephalus]|uniref:TMEM205-like domain-containing protein n=1 Tax=Psylliodes chrysocephalus TaxID=3402493 RepID=A0A9P0G7U6_9CUCU|nr:unnamed protein product [Psylliodes chrysocephala]
MCVGRIVSDFERTNSKNDLKEKTGIRRRDELLDSRKMGEESVGEFETDILGLSTKYVYSVFDKIKNLQQKFFQSIFYKILRYTTQPAHFVTAISVLFIAFLMVPGNKQYKVSPIWSLIYLGSFSAHFGTQIWMTFVSGLALFFSLSRHTFGSVQQVLFPKYFLLNATLSFITLFVFMKMNNSVLMDSIDNIVQAVSIGLCFMLELVVLLYFTPPLLYLINIKQKIEKEAGVGLEVGKYNLGPLKDCPYYLKIHRGFRRIHMTIAILNLLTMACTTLHLYYLSHKLCDI